MAKATGTDRVKSKAKQGGGKRPARREATKEQLATLIGVVGIGVAKANLSFDEMQTLLSRKSAVTDCIAKALRVEASVLFDPSLDFRLICEQQFWARLGVAVPIDDLVIPKLPKGFIEIAIIPKHLSAEQLLALCTMYFPAWKSFEDINREAPNTRQLRPERDYVIGYRRSVGPDLEHLGTNYHEAMVEGLTFMNLKERLVAELRYAAPHGVYLHRHLDVVGGTVTSSTADANADTAYFVSRDVSGGGIGVDGCSRREVGSTKKGPREVVIAS